MNSLVVLVALAVGLVHSAPHDWAGVPLAHAGYAHAGYAHGHAPAWHGPINIPVVLPSGHLADTHEVAALRAAHAVAVANTPVAHGGYAHGLVAAHGGYGHGVIAAPHAYAGAHGAWHGPQNIPVVLPSGHLADTPEVAALKAAHVASLHGAHHY